MIAKIVNQENTLDENQNVVGRLITIFLVHEGYDENMEMPITGYVTGNPTMLICPNHSCVAGDYCGVENIVPANVIPGQFQVLSVVDENTIAIDLDTTGLDEYSSGGSLFMADTSKHGYRLTDEEVTAVNADQSGTNEALKSIAVDFARRVQTALLAQAAAEAAKQEDTSIIDLSPMLMLFIAFAIGAIIFGISYGIKAKARKSVHEYHCTDQGMTYQKAQELLKQGAKYLDANSNGIACDTLYHGTK